ncbi:MAG: mucoidy inhibitor MuiA family protein, partial [Bacteroidetes bacterium]|nr:mucoidy inhibitor MuiA family protein [Bacteroidota bacterium]
MVLPAAAQDEPSSDDEQRVTTRVTAVTVYQRGAQVTREAEVTLPAGRTTLVFGNLTPALDPSSIQLSGTGAFTLLSVSHRTNYLEAASDEEPVKALRARKTALEDSLAYVEMLREVYQQEEKLLSENKALGGQDGVDVEELKAAATYFRERLTDLKTQKLDVRRAEQDLRREIRRLDQQIREQQGGRRGSPVGEVVVAVSADRSTEGTFTLQYLTEKAGWTASYNARVEDVDAPLQLSMKANVRQATNVDWTDVRLTLSTGTPTRASTLPDLQPWRLAFPRAARWRGKARVITGAPASNPRVVAGRVTDAMTGEPIPGANLVIEGAQVGTTTNGDGNYRLRVPGEAETLRATFVGYNSLSTPITSERIDFVLKASNAKLDEVVVRSSSRDASQGQRS